MKKKYFNIAWLIAVLLSFTACNDFLDIQPIGKVMPKTGQEFRDLLTEAYSAIPPRTRQDSVSQRRTYLRPRFNYQ